MTNYVFGSGATTRPSGLILPQLDGVIRKLHAKVGNALTEGYYIIPAAGSTQAMAAALYAMATLNPQPEGPLHAFSQIPYYSHYAYQARATSMAPTPMVWDAEASLHPARINTSYVELLTLPNNPDNSVRTPLVKDPSRIIYDCVYLWPQFNKQWPLSSTPLAEQVLFSISHSTHFIPHFQTTKTKLLTVL